MRKKPSFSKEEIQQARNAGYDTGLRQGVTESPFHTSSLSTVWEFGNDAGSYERAVIHDKEELFQLGGERDTNV